MIFSALALLGVGAAQAPVLAVDTWVVGTRVSGRWRPVDHTYATGKPPVTLRSFRVGTLGVSPVRAGVVGEEVSHGCYLSGADALVGSVHVSGLTPRVPRRVVAMAPDNPTYRKVVRDFLDGKGLTNAKVRLARIFRTDLDGDGTDEVLIEASSRGDLDRVSSMDTGKDDYSLVLLRYVQGGRGKGTALEFVSRQRGETLELKGLRGVADLDGDGRMEIVTTGKGYEWNNARLWSFRKGRLRMLLENGEGV
ncbi:MAG: hypothetical protein ACO1SV_13255 [Fimbriimonas sp.]